MLLPGKGHSHVLLQREQGLPPIDDLVLQLDHLQSTPLRFSPPGPDDPFLDLDQESSQVLWIRFHQLIKLGKLSWPKEDLGHPELEVFVIEAERLEESLAKESGVETEEIGGHEGFVHVVKLGEGSPTWEALQYQQVRVSCQLCRCKV